MAFDSTVTKFAAPASTGTQTIDTGLGVTPQGLWGLVGTLTTTEDAVNDDVGAGWGLCDEALNQGAGGIAWPWDANDVDGNEVNGAATDNYFIVLCDAAGTVIASAAVTAVNADGTFDLDWDVVTGVAFPIYVHAFAGVANIVVGQFALDDTVDSLFETLGFDPTFAICAGVNGQASGTGYFLETVRFVASLPHIPTEAASTSSDAGAYLWHESNNIRTGIGGGISVFGGVGVLGGFDWDRWTVECDTDGLQVTRVDDDPDTVYAIDVRYLAMDTVVAEQWSPSAHDHYVLPDAARQTLSRVAANSVLTAAAFTGNPGAPVNGVLTNQGFGSTDRFGNSYLRHWAAVQNLIDVATEVGSGFYDGKDAVQGYPRQDTGEAAAVFRHRLSTVTRHTPADPNLADFIFQTFTGGTPSAAVGRIIAPYIILGELALPLAETLPPIVHCGPGDLLYLDLRANVNPNQLPSEISWEVGTAPGVYTETFGPFVAHELGATNAYRLNIDHYVYMTVGSPYADVPFPGTPPTIIQFAGSEAEQTFDWVLGDTYYYRVCVETFNGVACGEEIAFVIRCGRPQIWRYR